MKKLLPASIAFVIAVLPGTSVADIKAVAPDGFLVEHRFAIDGSREAAWDVLVHPERYWPDDHTWSGSARNLSLRAEGGGCFCEAWSGSSVEHGRVVMALPGKLLRIRGALGPLQEMALTGVLSIQLEPDGSGCEAIVTYRVSGDSLHDLQNLAPVVDQVVGLQFGGFAERANRVREE